MLLAQAQPQAQQRVLGLVLLAALLRQAQLLGVAHAVKLQLVLGRCLRGAP